MIKAVTTTKLGFKQLKKTSRSGNSMPTMNLRHPGIEDEFTTMSSIATADNYRKQSMISTESFVKRTSAIMKLEGNFLKIQRDSSVDDTTVYNANSHSGVGFQSNTSQYYPVAQDAHL